MKSFSTALLLTVALAAQSHAEDLLVKVANPVSTKHAAIYFASQGFKSEALTDNWIQVKGNVNQIGMQKFLESGSVVYVQKNYKIHLQQNPHLQTELKSYLAAHPEAGSQPLAPQVDNPEIPPAPTATTGADPLFSSQWGMNDIGTTAGWNINRGTNKVIVAVIDTGVDYTHEDLMGNLWRNPKEIPNNGIDDDNNGYIDDIIGWDFLSNDNKPYDLAAASLMDLLNGGNPGHGTHCAGNVAAVGGNGKGISGVAPNAQIMALRFIGNEGGTTAAAIKAIKYAVDNGAKVLSNSWGSEGEDPAEATENQALQDAVQYAKDHDVLFIAAAGNSSKNNDTDDKKSFPASYTHDNIISVAAIDSADNIASFSNVGATSVDIAAPGVKIFSTTVGGKYSDTVIALLNATWDGTSMACPHVAGAAALYWSAHPEKTYAQVRDAILGSAKSVPSAQGKVLTGGKLSVEQLMKF
ncbi:MAG: S8 family serine peptidase [Bdellovibrio sp.]|nr:S8 family serine peptidase [Bdellovibrio sp.]